MPRRPSSRGRSKRLSVLVLSTADRKEFPAVRRNFHFEYARHVYLWRYIDKWQLICADGSLHLERRQHRRGASRELRRRELWAFRHLPVAAAASGASAGMSPPGSALAVPTPRVLRIAAPRETFNFPPLGRRDPIFVGEDKS